MLRRTLALFAVAATMASGLAVGLVATASADTYTPPPGMKLNNPLNKTRWNIQNHLVRTINSVPRGQTIRIISWNVENANAAKALIKAHHRGVSVQVLASKDQATNSVYRHLRAGLRPGNAARRPGTKSWARICRGSCRGKGGTAHIKFYLFSKVNHTPHVSMWGSANLTRFAATGQWNDLYTVDGNTYLYNRLMAVFAQDERDKPLANPLVKINTGGVALDIFPWYGSGASGEPVINELNRVSCSGATNGIGGHTKIRVAINAQQGNRGLRIARKIGELKRRGCNVRVIYGQFGADTYNAYAAAHVPFHHIVQDFNGDGVYDRYLHNKALVIQGNYAGRRGASVVLFGSANYSNLAVTSDETFTRLTGSSTAAMYANWIDKIYVHPPRMARLAPEYRNAHLNPYAKFATD